MDPPLAALVVAPAKRERVLGGVKSTPIEAGLHPIVALNLGPLRRGPVLGEKDRAIARNPESVAWSFLTGGRSIRGLAYV